MNEFKMKTTSDQIRKIDFEPKLNVSIDFGELDLDLNQIVIKNEALDQLNPFSQSQIFTEIQAKDLLKLCEFNLDTKWKLIYQGSKDGFLAENFHLNCNDKYPTLSIFKAKQTQFIFGRYTEACWSHLRGEYKSDSAAFLFSLV